MNRKVYINNMALYNKETDKNIIKEKYIDHISSMCILTIGKLLDKMKDEYKNAPVFFGSAYSCLKSLHEFNEVCECFGALRVNPGHFPNTVLNAPSSYASIHHSITKPIYNISNGNLSVLSTLELAYMYICNGESDTAIVCFADEVSDFAQQIEHDIEEYCGALYLSLNQSNLYIDNIIRRKSGKTNCETRYNRYLLHALKRAYEGDNSDNCIIVDCKNGYETVITICSSK